MFDFVQDLPSARAVPALQAVIVGLRYVCSGTTWHFAKRHVWTRLSPGEKTVAGRIANEIEKEEETSLNNFNRQLAEKYVLGLTELLERSFQKKFPADADMGKRLLERLREVEG
jgi:hypothetical protein